jgi:hypothetical protein
VAAVALLPHDGAGVVTSRMGQRDRESDRHIASSTWCSQHRELWGRLARL